MVLITGISGNKQCKSGISDRACTGDQRFCPSRNRLNRWKCKSKLYFLYFGRRRKLERIQRLHKTTDTSVSGSWPSRLYTATQLPDDTNYIKIAYPTGNTWQFNMNKLQLTGGEVIPEGKAVVSLDANGGSLPEGQVQNVL